MVTYKIIGADGKEYGPISADALKQWIAEGRANGMTRVLSENAADWRYLKDLTEFNLGPIAGQPVPGPVTPIPSVIVAPTSRRTNPLATTGLVLGIVSITFGLCCCSGFPFSVAGVICSGIALSQIKQNPAQEGRGMALAGLIISIVGLLVGVVIVVVYGLMSSMPDLMHRLQNL